MAWSIALSPSIGSGSPIAQAVVAALSLAGAAPLVTVSSGGAPFDFFISATGSNSNPGTQAAPWAITALNTKQAVYAGKRIGIIQGTYDVSGLMNPTFHTPALNINGGPNAATPTVIAPCDASGNYLVRGATLDAKGASGLFGGSNANISSIIGQGFETNAPANKGNFIIDGLRCINYSMWAMHVGNYDGAGGVCNDWQIVNCELTGGNDQLNTKSSGVNVSPIVIYAAQRYRVANNFIHDNFGPGVTGDATHFSAIYVWGLAGLNFPTIDGLFEYNTIVNSGSIHGKNGNIAGTTIRFNYIDASQQTPAGGYQMCLQGFEGAGGAAGTAGKITAIYGNILIAGANGLIADLTAEENDFGYQDELDFYSNTLIQTANTTVLGVRFWTDTGGARKVRFYNNLFSGGGAGGSAYGNVSTNLNAFALCDFNLYNGHDRFTTNPAGSFSSASSSSYSSIAAWAAVITANGSGATMEANSSSSTANPFTAGGNRAFTYLTPGGSATGVGRVGGVVGGQQCNLGAWDGITAVQIGSQINGARD